MADALSIIWGQFADIGFDLRHGTDTVLWRSLPSLKIASKNCDRGNIYQATTTVALRRLLSEIRPLLPDNAGILDIGSGKGKVLLLAAEYEFNPIRGVEFSDHLCGIARKNINRYFRHRASAVAIDVIAMDAADYPVKPDENLFFFFNPFDAAMFQIVIENIAASLRQHPRPAYIIYNNPEHRHIIEQDGTFRIFRDHHIGGNQFLIFRNSIGDQRLS